MGLCNVNGVGETSGNGTGDEEGEFLGECFGEGAYVVWPVTVTAAGLDFNEREFILT
jgi:hypothetical protein